MPAGCAETFDAIDLFEETAGDTSTSIEAAASQATHDITAASLDASGDVYTVMTRLAQGFGHIMHLMRGWVSNPDYGDTVTGINDDIAVMNTVCTAD